MKIFGSLIVGKRPEPYLESCIDSIYDAVDELIVNDNSGQEKSENLEAIERSRMFREGRVSIIPGKFEGFAFCRNISLNHIKAGGGEDDWILRIDADETHTDDLACLTRELLPLISPAVGGIDAYYYKFMISLNYLTFIERRHQWLVRVTPRLEWSGRVHEKLNGVRGTEVAIPYVYFDYSYVLGDTMLKKWKFYRDLGDPTYSIEELERMDDRSYLNHEVKRCFPFTGEHTNYASKVVSELSDSRKDDFARFDKLCHEFLKKGINRFRSALRVKNFKLRMLWRAMESMTLFDRRSRAGKLLFDITKRSNERY